MKVPEVEGQLMTARAEPAPQIPTRLQLQTQFQRAWTTRATGHTSLEHKGVMSTSSWEWQRLTLALKKAFTTPLSERHRDVEMFREWNLNGGSSVPWRPLRRAWFAWHL